jgi:alcohol dehydrogenase (NADP+)
MMTRAIGYAAPAAKAELSRYEFERRAPRASDVDIDILYCGVCHSDLHQARDEWGGSIFPMVPGHEIVGRVLAVGSAVTELVPGDLVGVGCMVDSCRTCPSCAEGLENYCELGFVPTYNGYERGTKTPTQGGYATRVVVDEAFVVRVPASIPLAGAAPLLCAGVTTYAPLKAAGIGPGKRVGVVGLGGLGHMAIKYARAFGAEVVLLTTSEGKRADGLRLGAHQAVLSTDKAQLKSVRGSLDFILDTVAAPHDLDALLNLLRRDGTLHLVGVPEKDHPAPKVANLIFKRRKLAGSLIGSIAETQEMLDYSAAHGIAAEVEVVPVSYVNEAFTRMLKNDVKYRFVLDLAELKGG